MGGAELHRAAGLQSCTFCASVIRTARRCSVSSRFAPPAPTVRPPAPPCALPPAVERLLSALTERTSSFESASSLS